MLLPALLIVLAWTAVLLLVAGLCAAACRGDQELAQGARSEPGPSLQAVTPAPAVEAQESRAPIAA